MVNPGITSPTLVDSACDLQHGLKPNISRPVAFDATHAGPVGVDGLVVSPSLERSTIITPLPDANTTDPVQALVQSVLPGTARAPQVFTPAAESDPVLNPLSLDNIVGTRIAPVTPSAVPPPSSLSLKAAGLRLPSFEALGIANPHSSPCQPLVSPPRSRLSDPVPTFMGGGQPADTELLSGDRGPGSVNRALSLDSHGRLPLPIRLASQAIETLTPPEDQFPLPWSSLALSSHTDSHGRTIGPGQSVRPGRPAASLAAQQPITPASSGSESIQIPRIELQRTASDDMRSSWIGAASNTIVNNLRESQTTTNALRVLSHALPCPSPSGFAFPFIISTLQMTTIGSPLCWINVFHALPGKFGLNDVPTSPPSTPDPPVGGQDYFTSMTFDSAVRVLDYQDNLTSMPRSPHPIVPPSTIGVSIIERYIPPTNSNEFAEMFDVAGRSLLVDRLVELSMDSGSLLFIYPTRTGAQTFTRDYLGPILDPLLRSMRTIHHLPVDLAASLGKMSAVGGMLEFEDLQRRVAQLCNEVGNQNSKLRKYSAQRSRFIVDMAQRQNVMMERSVWAERWWTKQEKTRIKETVTKYFRIAHRVSDQSDITPTSLIHAVLDGVISKPYPPGRAPTTGVEVGVFVIRRVAAED